MGTAQQTADLNALQVKFTDEVFGGPLSPEAQARLDVIVSQQRPSGTQGDGKAGDLLGKVKLLLGLAE